MPSQTVAIGPDYGLDYGPDYGLSVLRHGATVQYPMHGSPDLKWFGVQKRAAAVGVPPERPPSVFLRRRLMAGA
jgi:hypothetical protein